MGRERKVVFLLWLGLLAEAVFFALVQPVWSRVDEAQHYDFVQHVVEWHSLPVEGQDFVSQQVIDISVQSNQWGWRPVGALSTPAYLEPATWITVPQGLGDQDQERWVRRNLWHFSYEGMQPPLYYAINAPVYAALPGGEFVKLYGMRLLAALMASAMIPLAWLTARELAPEDKLLVYGTPAIVLLTQGYALNMSQITNDALAVPLAAAALLLLIRMVNRGMSYGRSLAAGAVIGAALLSKLTAIFLLPVALAALAVLVFRRKERLGAALANGALMFGTSAALLAPWVIHNLVVYGDATGAGAAQPLMSSFFESPLTNFASLRLNELLPTFWFGEPVFPFDFWTFAWMAAGAAMVLALIGVLFFYLRRHEERVQRGTHDEERMRRGTPELIRIDFAVIAFVIGVLVIVLIPYGSGIGGVPGRYLYPVLPLGAFLMLFGLERLLHQRTARFAAEAMLVWMVLWESLNLLAYIQGR